MQIHEVVGNSDQPGSDEDLTSRVGIIEEGLVAAGDLRGLMHYVVRRLEYVSAVTLLSVLWRARGRLNIGRSGSEHALALALVRP